MVTVSPAALHERLDAIFVERDRKPLEDLDVETLDREMQRIAEFLGIEWDEVLLTPTLNGVPTQANSMDAARLGKSGRVTIEPAGKGRSQLTFRERVIARLCLTRAVRRWTAR